MLKSVADETAVAGPVVITVTEALATYSVLRHLSALRAAYPALRVELRGTERTLICLCRGGIALRLARPYRLDLRSRRIARLDFGLYTSPGLDRAVRFTASLGDLKNRDVIGWADERPDYPAIRWFTKATDISGLSFGQTRPPTG